MLGNILLYIALHPRFYYHHHSGPSLQSYIAGHVTCMTSAPDSADTCSLGVVQQPVLPVAVVGELVVAGHGDEAAICGAQGVEDLGTRLTPHL